MTHKRFLSLLLSILMLISLLPAGVTFAADTPTHRDVFLHALGDNPKVTKDVSTVYMGETTELYFAIDNPNMGEYKAGKHLQPQYDLNGYTVKIYFDPAFFDYAGDSQFPIDYTIPDTMIPSSGSGSENVGGEEVEDTPQIGGYYPYRHAGGSEKVGNKLYKTAYVTVFFSGKYLPEKTWDGWYNLCKLPLTPLKTGNTDVFIDVDGSDELTLELFAKNVEDDPFAQTFTYSARNGGYHHIIIKDKSKPSAPTATPNSGRYVETQYVTLEAEEGCDIYYSTDGESFVPYTKGEKIEVKWTGDISCYAVRQSDGKQSNTVVFNYEIVPKAPLLFNADKTTLTPGVHSEYSNFNVYASYENPFAPISDEMRIYYTYTDLDADDIADGGSNPAAEWAEVPASTQSILIDKTCTVRLVTKNVVTGELSDVSVYYLGVKPGKVTADPVSGEYDTKIDVELTTDTVGARIYYTTDGSDPRTNGMEYTVPVTISRDTTLRAVAHYDGQYGDISSYYYLISYYDDYGVDAFYPSGVYEGSVNVTLTAANPENSVIYSTDGGNTWLTYEEVLNIDKDTLVIAKAIGKDGKSGDEYRFTYRIKPLPPEFAPESTQFTNADKITIYSPESTNETTSRYKLYYTLDGSDPVTSPDRREANDESDSVTITIQGYTVISAVVLKDNTGYSNVVTHSYDIVTKKPIKPITTLTPGDYTVKIGDTDGYSTQFMPVPNGTKIYYTLSYGGGFCPDPVPGVYGTIEYDGTPIDIKGDTLIKAVAVNIFGVKSDIGIFDYTVTPEAPKAAPSATINSDNLPVVPVDAVTGSTVKYDVNGVTIEFVTHSGRFYIDTATGNAYEDEDCTKPLGTANDADIKAPAVLTISAVLDGVESQQNKYTYDITSDDILASPYADKEMGTYEEINIDGENNLLLVKLYSLNKGDTIEYRFGNDGTWTEYDSDCVKLTEDTVLQLRSVKGDKVSAVVSYVYNFVPMAPIITLPSGRYSQTPVPDTKIELDSRAPTNKRYSIWYRENGDTEDLRYMNAERQITHTMSFKAYVLNEDTRKVSANTIHYYIIEPDNAYSGSVYVASPYDVQRISADVLTERPYSEGIKLLSQNKNAEIHYFYSYTRTDGTGAATNNYIYDNGAPIIVNSLMDNITIHAWLVQDGERITDSEGEFPIDFVHLEVPETSLTASGKTEFDQGTKYTLINDYPGEPYTVLYYTLDGSDPADRANTNRMAYAGEELSIDGETVVKAAYLSACGKCPECKDERIANCWNPVYSKVGTYRYIVPTVKHTTTGGSGGGGGSRVVDKTRKYTKDIFGNEHPTHIGYIKGYPDGSVQPDGNITREEMVTILYRVKNRAYDEPFTTTGEVFPDVSSDRWSVTEIEYMTSDGVAEGYPDGEFKPARKLTRAEFAALICRYAGIVYKGEDNVFPDLPDDHWAHDYILALHETSLIQGYEDGTFRPEREITRAEVMTVMNKLLGRKPYDPYVKTLNYNPYNDLDIKKWYYTDVMEATITHNYYLNDTEIYEIKWEDIK